MQRRSWHGNQPLAEIEVFIQMFRFEILFLISNMFVICGTYEENWAMERREDLSDAGRWPKWGGWREAITIEGPSSGSWTSWRPRRFFWGTKVLLAKFQQLKSRRFLLGIYTLRIDNALVIMNQIALEFGVGSFRLLWVGLAFHSRDRPGWICLCYWSLLVQWGSHEASKWAETQDLRCLPDAGWGSTGWFFCFWVHLGRLLKQKYVIFSFFGKLI